MNNAIKMNRNEYLEMMTAKYCRDAEYKTIGGVEVMEATMDNGEIIVVSNEPSE